ncbi:hypothetical protein AWC04_18390 [Mycolicibacterium fallax]|uniref:DUF4926 domain-containing protein n=2 Tax=Mycolicibacterium fallax TaxID=1793 RepID=A0A1X1R024_MYCFA|nr:hypothetical protein AWC04_18390 [Mycolicibacterium fallax]
MYPELSRVALTRPVPAYGLPAGTVGAVVGAYSDGVGYEVEFVAADGRTIAVLTLTADDLAAVPG